MVPLSVFFLICATLLSKGSSLATERPNNSSLADQCVTREEVQEEIQDVKEELETQLGANKQELITAIHTNKEEEIQDEIQQIRQVQNQMRNELQSIRRMVQDLMTPPLGSFHNPAQSCSSIRRQPSEYYWIQNGINGTLTREYCDMTRRCCGSTGGWMLVANLDMTDLNKYCPSRFKQITSPRRMCTKHSSGCVSASFPVHGVQFSRVCGRVIGYQYASPNAFEPYYKNRAKSIDNIYVDGVSITHGHSPRKHIWTFAAALDEYHSPENSCPCTRTDRTFTGAIPPFVGNDYFCETGSRNRYTNRHYLEDPLWNGRGCGSRSTCCGFNNPPWFCKRLPQATRDDIEVRICADASVSNENIGIEIIELYIK